MKSRGAGPSTPFVMAPRQPPRWPVLTRRSGWQTIAPMASGIDARQVEEADPRGARRSIAGIALAGNLLGALLTFFYFQLVDPVGSETPVEPAEIAFFPVAFGALMGLLY
jgi:hypothetical protein